MNMLINILDFLFETFLAIPKTLFPMLRTYLITLLVVFVCSIQAQVTSTFVANTEVIEDGMTLTPDANVQNTRIINTPHLEFSPVFYENGIVYVTSQKPKARVDKNIGEAFFELYYAELDMSGLPIRPQAFSARINTRLHEGPVSFNSDYSRIFFTRNNILNEQKELSDKDAYRMKIYEGEKGPQDWINISELSFNSEAYSCIHPSLAADEQKLYFASNMPGGYGGYDLYVVSKQGNSWGTPLNLGGQINTDKNEAFPFIYQNDKLFFASLGHEGQGGYDIFLANIENTASPVIKNIGVPFNSSADDLGFTLNEAGTQGFFTSSRAGGVGKDDIYKFDAPEGFFGKKKEEPLEATIFVFDTETQTALPNAEIRVFRQAEDGMVANPNYYDAQFKAANASERELQVELVRRPSEKMGPPNFKASTDGTVKAPLDQNRRYVFVASKEGYEDDEVFYSTMDNSGNPYLTIGLSKIPEPKPEPTPPPPPTINKIPIAKGSVIVLDKIFYDFGKSAIRKGAAHDLDAVIKVMRQYPDMTIELSAHTDSRGSGEYNEQLSLERAISAKDYLVVRGIDANRVTTRGYGEERLRNHCADGVRCSELEHQYNRRTEIKILTRGEAVEVEYLDNSPDKVDRAPKRKSRQ